MLYLSWIHHEKSYLVEQSPIMHAMLESAERTQAEVERKEKEASRLISARKSQRKVRIQTPGEMQGQMQGHMQGQRPSPAAIHTVLNRPTSNPTAGPPPPSAADYVPPSVFLQNMTNPPNHLPQPRSVPEYFNR
jgi:hypothetical protein